ncbi:MAG: tetratricopeptide repeat protein [Sterolibacterium sp.]|nr:tetratricopeptide repeat protein [Sterolibacterium sp.]
MFRLVNVGLHIMVGGAIYLFVRTLHGLVLTKNSDPQDYARNGQPARLAMWLSVALFLLHPVAVYAVAYLVQRSIVMATLFSLLMWWAHLRGLHSAKPGWFVLAALFCYLALYSKEHSVMAPAVAGLLTLLVSPKLAARRWLILAFITYSGLALSVVLLNRNEIATAYEPLIAQMGIKVDHPYLSSVVTQTGLFFKYLLLGWIPITSWMSIDIREPLADVGLPWNWLYPCLFLAYCVAGLLLLMRKGRLGLLGFSMLAPALLFMTELATVRIQESFVLYRSYLWLSPMLVAFPLVFRRSARPGGSGYGLALTLSVGFLSVYFALSAERLNTFSSSLLVWDDAISLADHRGDSGFRDRQYVNRGGAYQAYRNYDLALQDFDRALVWNPDQVMAHLGKGRVLFQMGRLEQARNYFNRAIALKPDWVDAYLARGNLSNRIGDREAALADLQKACALAPGFACYAKEKLLAGAGRGIVISVSSQ